MAEITISILKVLNDLRKSGRCAGDVSDQQLSLLNCVLYGNGLDALYEKEKQIPAEFQIQVCQKFFPCKVLKLFI